MRRLVAAAALVAATALTSAQAVDRNWPQWRGPELNGTYSGSPVLADGHIYVTNEEGLTSVYKAGRKFELVAQNPLNDYCLSSPAVSEGQIFIRTSGHLWAIGNRKK